MRIVQLNPYHYPYMGGIEHRIHEVSRRLSSRHEMIVLTAQLKGTSSEETMNGYTVVRLPSKFINIYNPPFVSTPGVLEALEELDPDLIDFHYRWAPSYSKAMRQYKGKWVFTFHNTFGEGHGPGRVLSALNDSLFCRRIKDQRVICITEFIKRDLVSRGFREDLMDVVPPGVDTIDGTGSDEGFVLFMGRLVGTKGLPYLVKAMAEVDGRLVIAGSGPEKKNLEALVHKLGLAEKVELTGQVDETTKQRLMSTCSVFAMPSLFESLGLAVAEAMSWGKPIVASRVGGLPEVVGNGGFLVPPKNPHAIAQALDRLLGDDALRMDLGAKARVNVRKYAWDKVIDNIEKVYLRAAEE